MRGWALEWQTRTNQKGQLNTQEHPGVPRRTWKNPRARRTKCQTTLECPKAQASGQGPGGRPGGGTRSSPGGHQGGARSSPGGRQEGTGSIPEGTSEGPGAARGALGSARNSQNPNLDEYLINICLGLINIVSAFNKYSIGLIKNQIRQTLIQFYIIPKKSYLINIHAGF